MCHAINPSPLNSTGNSEKEMTKKFRPTRTLNGPEMKNSLPEFALSDSVKAFFYIIFLIGNLKMTKEKLRFETMEEKIM